MTTNSPSPSESYLLFFKIFKFSFIFALLVALISILSTTLSIYHSPTINFGFCFNNECLERTIAAYSSSIKILQSLLITFTSMATIGGIFIALKSYINTYNSSILHNHISHFSLFKDFILGKLDKRDKLHISSFDIFKWYNLIYTQSKLGSMVISSQYTGVIDSINSAINSSNEQVSVASEGSFYYKKHQYKLIDVMEPLGVKLGTLPRNNFYDVETQLISLISVINDEFCSDDVIPKLNKRDYI